MISLTRTTAFPEHSLLGALATHLRPRRFPQTLILIRPACGPPIGLPNEAWNKKLKQIGPWNFEKSDYWASLFLGVCVRRSPSSVCDWCMTQNNVRRAQHVLTTCMAPAIYTPNGISYVLHTKSVLCHRLFFQNMSGQRYHSRCMHTCAIKVKGKLPYPEIPGNKYPANHNSLFQSFQINRLYDSKNNLQPTQFISLLRPPLTPPPQNFNPALS